jgi:hypothetical protein
MLLRCTTCRAIFQLEGQHDPLEGDLREGPVKCPFCLQTSIVPTAVRDLGSCPHELTAEQFWQATHGFGLPDEIVTEPETVHAMLLAHRIVDTRLLKAPSGRVIIDSVLLDNGITLHFTASGGGAVIFKSTRTKEKEDAS